MFRKLELRTNYSSEADDLYRDFFLPTLSEAVTYRRAVGFFSLSVLLNVPAAMSCIVNNGGRIELIFGKLVSAEDFEAIREGMKPKWKLDELPRFDEILTERPGSLLEYRVRLLAWLFTAGRLEMKIALRPQGMFHQKIGLLEDKFGDRISFSGSMNETISALDPRFNSEEVTVFQSWNEGQKEYVDSHSRSFDRLWSGDTGSSTAIFPVPEAISDGLNLVAERFPAPPSKDEEEKKVKEFLLARSGSFFSHPTVPYEIQGTPFAMRSHQLEALRAWSANGYNGILELATGAGKTITAIYAATKTAEVNKGIVLIVAVPYTDLADQWCQELRNFNIQPLRCYGSRDEWEPSFQSYLKRNRHDQSEFFAIVVVNKTLKSDAFQRCAKQLDANRIFFIGDECHHHGGRGYTEKMLTGARFRIGLSATPFHYLDEEANQRLKGVYDCSVYQYSLADAVRDKVLTPYEYIPVPVELTESESLHYIDLSDQIARAFATSQKDFSGPSGEKLKALLMRRARVVGAAENKMVELDRICRDRPVHSHSLFYCSDGRTLVDDDDEGDHEADPVLVKQRYAVAQLLMAKGLRVSPFTSDENKGQRREILRQFKEGQVSALVAIRCLDEGIDVPACRTAYLIASSRNPRQFIQRRGRILRRSPGKESALIYDFVVVLPEGHSTKLDASVDFLRAELARVADFARNSLYPASSVEPLLPWLRKYNLEHFAA